MKNKTCFMFSLVVLFQDEVFFLQLIDYNFVEVDFCKWKHVCIMFCEEKINRYTFLDVFFFCKENHFVLKIKFSFVFFCNHCSYCFLYHVFYLCHIERIRLTYLHDLSRIMAQTLNTYIPEIDAPKQKSNLNLPSYK